MADLPGNSSWVVNKGEHRRRQPERVSSAGKCEWANCGKPLQYLFAWPLSPNATSKRGVDVQWVEGWRHGLTSLRIDVSRRPTGATSAAIMDDDRTSPAGSHYL
jgi:hypothetical protein